MTYWIITSSMGCAVFIYGCIQDYSILAFIGIIAATVCMICAQILEDKLEDKIDKLEREIKKLKEIKSND